MPHRVIFSPRAEAQLLNLHKYIASVASPAVGERYAAAIVDYCLAFATFPHRGTRRDDIRQGLRTVGYRRRATIAFEVAGDTINILGVYYGGQDFEGDFRAGDG